MVIMECNNELNTTTQLPGDTIKWLRRVFLARLAMVRAHGGVPGYHTMLLEQQVQVLMATSGAVATTADTMTAMTSLLAHVKVVSTMREKAAETSCEEYLAYKFLLL